MKLLIFHFALLFGFVIANPINPVEDPIDQQNEILDGKAGETLAKQVPKKKGSEYGDKFQGDIQLLPQQEESEISETGIINTYYRWPKVSGFVRVPYVFNVGYTTAEMNTIRSAMAEIQSKTCVRFNLRTTEANFIRFTNGIGCWSYIGKIGGGQVISLQKDGCVYKGTAMHELIHALGYGHQHSHYQRDQRVSINWNNIVPGKESNFYILSSSQYSNYATAYDIDSIMHYSGTSFSKNSLLTIQAKIPSEQYRMGQRTALSAGDIARIKNMYGC